MRRAKATPRQNAKCRMRRGLYGPVLSPAGSGTHSLSPEGGGPRSAGRSFNPLSFTSLPRRYLNVKCEAEWSVILSELRKHGVAPVG